MKIVGFQSGHDVSYCILENGIPTLHNEWERFLRCKEPQGDGLKFFFDKEEGKAASKDVAYFTHGNPRTRYGVWAHKNDPEVGEWPCFNMDYENKMKESGAQYFEYSHHLSHAANAFFSSNFEDALVLTLDGGGWEIARDYDDSVVDQDRATAGTLHIGAGNHINPVYVSPIAKMNIGMTWAITTRDVLGLSWGYPAGNAAGTLMAMAAVGEYDELIVAALKDVTKSKDAVDFLVKYVESDEQHQYNVAATLQVLTENLIKNVIGSWMKQTEERLGYRATRLCFAGGVALNSVCVGKIYDWFPQIEEIYIPPIPYDSGLAIGSAQYLYHHVLNNPRVDWNGNASPYLGRTYSRKEVMKAVKSSKLEYTTATDADVIELLSKDDNVVSVFGGGSESGRRALGNRSILADPRSKTMKAVINEKVKHRQSFRPFAPSILREEVSKWFVRDVDSPYMSCVIKFKEEVVDKVPAVCHFDNSARLQTVTENDNAWYYNFIKKFGEKTGVPILLNTSFNDREPIVETPENAIACFLKTDIDYLYFFDYGILIKKQL